jgi:ribosomal protein S18 acetylase RimI-like enzyme
MEPIDLRPATPDDYDFVFSVHCAAMRPSVEPIYGWDEDWQSSYLQEHFNPDERQIIRYGGADVGYISVAEQESRLLLQTIGILPEYQGRGIGTTLIRRLQRRARLRGVPLRLQVLKGNPARGLYERLGFKVFDATDTHYQLEWTAEPNQREEPCPHTADVQ